jgi:hypothetical protein
VLLDVSDSYTAYCLDNATAEFGQAVEAALHEVTGKTAKEIKDKSMRVLNKWLDRPQKYRSPRPDQVNTRPPVKSED